MHRDKESALWHGFSSAMPARIKPRSVRSITAFALPATRQAQTEGISRRAAARVCAPPEPALGCRAGFAPAARGVYARGPGRRGLVVSGWDGAQVLLPGRELCWGVLRPCRGDPDAPGTQAVDRGPAARL